MMSSHHAFVFWLDPWWSDTSQIITVHCIDFTITAHCIDDSNLMGIYEVKVPDKVRENIEYQVVHWKGQNWKCIPLLVSPNPEIHQWWHLENQAIPGNERKMTIVKSILCSIKLHVIVFIDLLCICMLYFSPDDLVRQFSWPFNKHFSVDAILKGRIIGLVAWNCRILKKQQQKKKTLSIYTFIYTVKQL